MLKRLGLPASAILCLVSTVFPAEREFNPRKVVRPFKAITVADFVQAVEVTNQVRDPELVLGVHIEGHARAYPINQLTNPTREIINDKLGERSIAATW